LATKKKAISAITRWNEPEAMKNSAASVLNASPTVGVPPAFTRTNAGGSRPSRPMASGMRLAIS
jgi:hypothetical protein